MRSNWHIYEPLPTSPGLQKSVDGPSPLGLIQGFYMKFVNLALDILFRTLDTIDAVRDRIDDVMGQSTPPEAWAVKWPAAQPQSPSNTVAAHQPSPAEPVTPTVISKKKATAKKKSTKKKATAKKKSTKR